MSNDIVDVISQYIHIQKKGNNYVGLCPFHNEKTGSFSVSPSKQMFYCFGCGTGGNVITFLMKYDNMTFPEAVKLLAQRANITLPEHEMTQEEKKRADKKTQIMEVNKEAATYFYKLLRSLLFIILQRQYILTCSQRTHINRMIKRVIFYDSLSI